MTTMRKLVPRNDHIKNKDRQDPAAVLTLCSEELTSFLSKVGYVCHTIIPELDKFTENNRLGMYPSPISVAARKYRWLLFLIRDSKHGSSILYCARLHSPVDKISVVKKTLPSNQVQCVEDVAFLTSQDGPVLVELEQNRCYLKPTNNMFCLFCQEPDSISHTFFNCKWSIEFYSEVMKWFNKENVTSFSPSPVEILFRENQIITLKTRINC